MSKSGCAQHVISLGVCVGWVSGECAVNSDDQNRLTGGIINMQHKFLGIGEKTPDTENPDANKVAAYGALAFLYLRSPMHNSVPLERARLTIQPPLDLGYYHIFKDADDVPRAAVSWAYLSDEAEARFSAGQILQPRDWRSGPNMWVIEIIAPFQRRTGATVMNWLRRSVPKEINEVKYLRLGAQGDVTRIVSCKRMSNKKWGASLLPPYEQN